MSPLGEDPDRYTVVRCGELNDHLTKIELFRAEVARLRAAIKRRYAANVALSKCQERHDDIQAALTESLEAENALSRIALEEP